MFMRRFIQLQLGLCLYGVAAALMVRSNLGLDPWNVFHQGLSLKTGMSLGTASIIMGVLVMLAWIPLRQKPGLGTLFNIFVIGLSMDAALAVLPEITGLPLRLASRWCLRRRASLSSPRLRKSPTCRSTVPRSRGSSRSFSRWSMGWSIGTVRRRWWLRRSRV